MLFGKITLVGVGLLGGSLGLAIKERRLARAVEGFVRRQASIAECHRFKVVDHATRNLPRAVSEADLVILCTPIAQMAELTLQMLPGLKPGAIVTDVGSVKGRVVEQLEPLVEKAGAYFIGSHPMAGAEKMGVKAARANLFERAMCVLTPTPKSPSDATQSLDQFWRAVGARVLRLSAADHDALVSRSSHLPHLVAAQLAHYVLDPRFPAEQSLLCATGFRDTTRIASGSPEMWRDIAWANRRNLDHALGDFMRRLRELKRALQQEDLQPIAEFFQQAKIRRDQWCESDTSPE
jgi:prephenate dehydrogenase